MKILQIGKFFPPENGGIEQVTFNLAEGLGAQGIRSDVLCFTRQTITANDRKDYSVFRHKTQAEPLSTPVSTSFWKKLGEIASNYDILHLHCPNPWPTIQLQLMPARTPLIVHWHGDIVRYGVISKMYGLLEEKMLKKADAIISTSQKYTDYSPALQRHLHKTEIIPIGIDLAALKSNQSAAESINARYPGKRIIFSLGRLIYYKGFDSLIRAAAKLPDDYIVLIGGTGPLANELHALIKELKLEEKVFLLGRLPDNELAAYYEACTLFCLPSIERSEAFGVVLLEAMAMSKPIVATAIPGSAVDWVNLDGESGLNVPPNDEGALAAAIRKLAEDPVLYKKYASGAHARLNQMFTREKMIASVIKLYEKVLNAKEKSRK